MDRAADGSPGADEPPVRIVLNPESGSADHARRVRGVAAERGYGVVETDSAADARRATRAAIDDGVGTLVPCGGDGTVHTVVQALFEADALDAVTLGVLPAGTANLFARNLDVGTLDAGFDALDAGRRRRIDVGRVTGADAGSAGEGTREPDPPERGRPASARAVPEGSDGEAFVTSFVAGFPAVASGAAGSGLKARLGTLAFAVSAVGEATAYEPHPVELALETPTGERTWAGDALCLLAGNSRRFTGEGGQGHVEDGLLEVAVVESLAPLEALREAAVHRLFDRGTEGVARFDAAAAAVTFLDGPVSVSLDGELSTRESFVLSAVPAALSVLVGPDYDPDPAT
ncbi:diacylglycerol/lipid kinase family protein [Halomarina halobia]|uniref:Diacylglycerol/lipid kinase family protein n=1 Tax=Halomarina halobia TaxID=3033386 RepID=A0ABD6ABT0_9EURY|nr:diacylglycerol kinase family protein [Halomarina sp. PSR21]